QVGGLERGVEPVRVEPVRLLEVVERLLEIVGRVEHLGEARVDLRVLGLDLERRAQLEDRLARLALGRVVLRLLHVLGDAGLLRAAAGAERGGEREEQRAERARGVTPAHLCSSSARRARASSASGKGPLPSATRSARSASSALPWAASAIPSR